VTLLKDEL